MKGFYINVSNGLLESRHRKAMGSAVWEFMWCLDRITKIDDEGLGWVLGGKPINLSEIAEELGITEPNVSKNLKKLSLAGYLLIKRTPYGISIRVAKAKKRFNRNVKSPNENDKSALSKTINLYRHNNKTYTEDRDLEKLTPKQLRDLVQG